MARMAPGSLALVLLSLLASAASIGACTSGATPNCNPDAGGSDACGIAFDGGGGDVTTGDDASETGPVESGGGGDTSMPADTGSHADGGSGDGASADGD